MKKLFYSILMGVIILSCDSQTKSDDSINLSFEKNSATMQALLDSYANEDVDYSRFSEEAVFRGTLLGAPDTLRLDQIKAIHKDFFAKYDVKHMAPFNFLQGDILIRIGFLVISLDLEHFHHTAVSCYKYLLS